MKSIHPATYIVFGFLIVSLAFNFLQSCDNVRLKTKLEKSSRPIVINLPNPYDSNPEKHQDNTI